MLHKAQSTLGNKGWVYPCEFPSSKLSPPSRHKAPKMAPRSSITSHSKSYNQHSYGYDFSSGDFSDQHFVDPACSASSHMEGINMNYVLVSFDGQAELQSHDLPHPLTASFLYSLQKTSPESPVNQGPTQFSLPQR
jgi:hypothetical protein